MPQHSFGASARACSTTSSRSCREIRRATWPGGGAGRRRPRRRRRRRLSPLIDSLNSRMPVPSDLPTSGSFLGPITSRAITRTMTSSIGPMLLNGMDVPLRRWCSRLPRRQSRAEDEQMLGVRREDRRGGHRDLRVRQRGQRGCGRARRAPPRARPRRRRRRRGSRAREPLGGRRRSRSPTAAARGVPEPDRGELGGDRGGVIGLVRRAGSRTAGCVCASRSYASEAPISRRHSPSRSPPSSVSARGATERRREHRRRRARAAAGARSASRARRRAPSSDGLAREGGRAPAGGRAQVSSGGLGWRRRRRSGRRAARGTSRVLELADRGDVGAQRGASRRPARPRGRSRRRLRRTRRRAASRAQRGVEPVARAPRRSPAARRRVGTPS